MKVVRTTLVAALGLAALLACVPVRNTRLGSAPNHPPVVADNVAFYMTAQQVGVRYDEIALLPAPGAFSATNEEQMYRKMQEKAGALGANGILLDSMSVQTTGAKVGHSLIGTPADRAGKAVAIFVNNPTSR
jgi:anti-anti-sigma regulatory factor